MRRHLVLPVLLLAGLPSGATAQAPAGQVVAETTGAPVKVSASGGWVAWSVREDNRFALILRSPEGVVVRPAVPTRGVPFDMDLGELRGRTTAVWSRCTAEPRNNQGTALPAWTSGRGCRIQRLDVPTGRVTTHRLFRGLQSMVLPTVGSNRMAFVGIPARSTRVARLMSFNFASGRLTRLQDVPRRDGPDPFGPTATDTDGKEVAMVRTSVGSLPSYDSNVTLETINGGSAVDAGGASQSNSCFQQVHGVTARGGRAVYVVTDDGSFTTVFARRRDQPTFGPSETASETGGVVVSSSATGGRLLLAERMPDGGGRIREVALGLPGRQAPAAYGSSCG